MKIFYDTEFIEDGETIGLLSIGMICEDGSTYYAVADDLGLIARAAAHPWLSENVLPSLPVAHSLGAWWAWDNRHRDASCVKPRKDIADEVRDFILRYPDPELWADYGAYDHVALCQLWGTMVELPEGIPMWTNDLRQVVARCGNPGLPSLSGITEHNALDDARELRFRFGWLGAHFMQTTVKRSEATP